MNDIIKKNDLKIRILDLLIEGKSITDIMSITQCDKKMIYSIVLDDKFAPKSAEICEKLLAAFSIRAVQELAEIMTDSSNAVNARIRASEVILNKAQDIKDKALQGLTPSTMSQDQLAARLNELQKEVTKRAKPIDTGITDLME